MLTPPRPESEQRCAAEQVEETDVGEDDGDLETSRPLSLIHIAEEVEAEEDENEHVEVHQPERSPRIDERKD